MARPENASQSAVIRVALPHDAVKQMMKVSNH